MSTSSAAAIRTSISNVGDDSPRSTRHNWLWLTPARSATCVKGRGLSFESCRIRLATRR